MRLSYSAATNAVLLASLLGAQALALSVGPFSISPYRFLVCAIPVVFSGMLTTAIFRQRVIVRYEYVLFLCLWVLYAFLSGVWVAERTAWLKAMVFLVSGCTATVLIFAHINTSSQYLNAIGLVAAASVAFGLLGAYEIFSGNYWFLDETNSAYYTARSQLTSIIGLRIPVSVFGNPNNYATFLVFACSFGFVLVRSAISTLQKSILYLVLAFNSFLLLATQSRAGIIAMFIFFGVYGLLALLVARGYSRVRTAAFLCGVVIVAWLAIGTALDQTVALLSVDLGGAGGNSDYVRLNLLRSGLHFLAEFNFFGVGVGNIEYHMQLAPPYDTGRIANIHNWWFEVLVSSGVYLFAGYVLVYLRTFARALRRVFYCSIDETNVIATACACLLIAFGVASVGPASLFLVEWHWPLIALVMKAPFITSVVQPQVVRSA